MQEILSCPNCNAAMGKVTMPSLNVGYELQIDQCPNCGGVWCDRYEAFQVETNATIKVDKVDPQITAKNSAINSILKCPKDSEVLLDLTDVNFPPELHIKRCHLCEGIWFNQGTLAEYKKNISAKQSEPLQENIWKSKHVDEDLLITRQIQNMARADRIARTAFGQMLPIPSAISSKLIGDTGKEPFILSENIAVALKKLPEAERLKIIKTLADDHNQTVERENRFIANTVSIAHLIFRFLIR